MITRRRFMAAAGSVGALGVALRARAGVRAAGTESAAVPAVTAPGRGGVLRIVQATPGAAPPSAVAAPLLWRLGAFEILDPRRLDERLARFPEARIHAVVDGGNHLLLVDALRAHGGATLSERWSASEQRWTLVARAGHRQGS
jgi:hypothetical protein